MAAKNVASDYDRRIRRAGHLASVHPFAREILAFYRHIAEFQKSAYGRILTGNKQKAVQQRTLSLRSELQIESLLPHFKEFLTLVAQHGPSTSAASARYLSSAEPASWSELLSDHWNTSGRHENPNAAFEQFLPRAFLQPYAEHLNAASSPGQSVGAPSLCPLCGARPLLGIHRQEGDGGKRFLLCSFCIREWEFRRIYCATCGEETEAKLPVYVAEEFPYIRVEACDTCKFYVRSVDLTKDGNAIPMVDDLAAIPLSLWAEEHGYSRAQPNLLGT
jgi:formate dehydrogenase accessory protein FdhE